MIMLLATARELVSTIAYMPGWEFSISDHSDRFEGAVVLSIRYPVIYCDRSEARTEYENANHGFNTAPFGIMIGDMDCDAFYHAVATHIMSIHEHEMREFLRMKPTFWAPFHPHHIDGIQRWNQHAKHVEVMQSYHRDLTFGIV